MLAERYFRLRELAGGNSQGQAVLVMDPAVAGRVDQQRRQMAGVRDPQSAGRGIEFGIHHGDEATAGKILDHHLLRRIKTSAGPEPVCASERNMPRVADISSAAAVPLPETSARTRPQRPSLSGMKSYQSPPTKPAGIESPDTAEPWDQRRAARQQSLLNGASLFGLAAHALALFALIAKAPGVVHRDGDVIAHSLQQS